MLTTDRFGSSATLTNSGPKKAWKKDEKTKLCYININLRVREEISLQIQLSLPIPHH